MGWEEKMGHYIYISMFTYNEYRIFNSFVMKRTCGPLTTQLSALIA